MKLQANGAPKNNQHPPHYYPELPTEVEERLEKLFKKLDINEDGRIDINDLTTGLQKLGLPHTPGSVEVSAHCSLAGLGRNATATGRTSEFPYASPHS